MAIPNTLNAAIEQAMQRKLAIYREWRRMGVCHADAVDSGLQNSCWGPALRAEFRAHCDAIEAESKRLLAEALATPLSAKQQALVAEILR